ncbi:hypothetical protein GQ43DRAFT_199641 [Delitschia confertaspora ATCC 74209]|uniref:Oxidase ustYa n=1 Tax=Delitschia confertaspora ATCC 74209 TaxID=1513339 RepID=A0A9P4JJD8_9PLEO|nr:hypothetical protein GQ43DRAFT_199641 [Delitschia confertaspora ATCC 74209]
MPSYLSATTCLLVISILFLSLENIKSWSGSYTSRDTGSFSPQFPRKRVVFARDPIFSEPHSPDGDAAWDSLMPEGRGFVLVENPEKYGYHGGVPTEKGVDRFSVSVFHQLHCLGMIRASYYKRNSTTQPIGHLEGDVPPEILDEVHNHHIAHCFDYLRQALMCSADTTIEWAKVQSTGERNQVDGWGIPHETCKDWNSVLKWMDENKAPAEYSGIL